MTETLNLADREVLQRVWGETSDVSPKDGADATRARLHAVVAKLAALAKKRGLEGELRYRSPPFVGSAEEPRYNTMKATVDAVEQDKWSGAALPARAALWDVTVTGAPRVDNDKPHPQAISWIRDDGVASGGDFVVGDGSDGRVFRLFESNKVPPEDMLPFVSAVTGSGLPKPETKSVHKKLAWGIGILAIVVFLAGGAMSAWSGRSMSGARNILNTSTPALQQALLSNVATICAEDYLSFPIGNQPAICNKVLKGNSLPDKDAKTGQFIYPNPAEAASVLANAKACHMQPTTDGCNTIWRAAVKTDQDQTWKGSLFGFLHKFSAYLTGTDPAAGSTSILVPFLLLLIGIAGLVIGLGLGTKNRVAGVWIDTRNRVSLARAQVTLWTAVVLAGYSALALFNIGFAGIVTSADDMATKFAAFPAIPESIAAALGIAAASPMISALILPTKDTSEKSGVAIRGGGGDLRSRGVPFFGAESEGLEKRASPRLASIADIFMGEEKANADTVDVSRLQNVVITVTLVLGFFSYLVAMTSSINAATILSATREIFTSLPELGTTFTSLLLVSHATYLVAKAHDSRSPAAETPDHA
jgi:hypothetical protein